MVNGNAIVSAVAVVALAPPAPEPDIAVSPTSLDFGTVVTGTTSDLVVTVTNAGSLDLNVTDLQTTNPVYTVVSPPVPFTLAPAGSQEVTVQFAPFLLATESGDLEIISDDPDEGLVTVPLTGRGVDPVPAEGFRINAGGPD